MPSRSFPSPAAVYQHYRPFQERNHHRPERDRAGQQCKGIQSDPGLPGGKLYDDYREPTIEALEEYFNIDRDTIEGLLIMKRPVPASIRSWRKKFPWMTRCFSGCQ